MINLVFYLDEKLSFFQKISIQKAANTWNKAIGKEIIKIAEESIKKRHLYSSDNFYDRINGIYLYKNWECSNRDRYVATVVLNELKNDPRTIYDGDMLLNDQFYDLTDTETITGPFKGNEVDTVSLAIHEFGHLLGLHHIIDGSEPDSVMVPSLSIGGNYLQRNLSANDIKRVRYIYNKAANHQSIVENLDQQLSFNQVKNLGDSPDNFIIPRVFNDMSREDSDLPACTHLEPGVPLRN